jgi:opacity protein-like surface antigen
MTKVILLLAASLVACCASATAGDWYASVYGGVNRNSVIEIPGVKDETGGVFGGAVGKRITAIPGLRAELDLSYRTNDVDVFGFVTAQHETTGALFNVAYDIDIGGDVKAYALVGGGYGHTQATFENISLLRLEASDFAYQAGAGASVPLAPGVSLSVGYRFFQAPVVEVFGLELSDGQNHSLIGSLSFDL